MGEVRRLRRLSSESGLGSSFSLILRAEPTPPAYRAPLGGDLLISGPCSPGDAHAFHYHWLLFFLPSCWLELPDAEN